MPNLTISEIDRLAELLSQTTAGDWISCIEGRDHESGSNFISTNGDDIELTGASHSDQDFIAFAHSCMPRILNELRQHRSVNDF